MNSLSNFFFFYSQLETQITSLKQAAPSREFSIELELNQKLVKQLREKIDLYESQYSSQKSELDEKKGQIAQFHIKMESLIKENIEYKASLNLLQQKLQDATVSYIIF